MRIDMGAKARAPVDKGVRFGRRSQREAKVRHREPDIRRRGQRNQVQTQPRRVRHRSESETGRTEASFGHRNGGESQAQRHG